MSYFVLNPQGRPVAEFVTRALAEKHIARQLFPLMFTIEEMS